MRKIKIKTLIVNRNTHDLALNQKRQIELMSERIPFLENEVIIYNCEEEPFLGKLAGHHQALQEYKDDNCDYYWFNHPDLTFAIDFDCLKKLLLIMERNPWVGVLSPTEKSIRYIGMFREGFRWHPTATVDYLSLLIRRSVIEKIGFLNPDFEYSWGAIQEYSYKTYKNGWCVAYADVAKMHHFGGTTYGQKGMVSRQVYQQKAKDFAARYFVDKYGKNWDKEFSRMLPGGVKNSYKIQRMRWEGKLRKLSLLQRFNQLKSFIGGMFMDEKKLQLHLGCGLKKRKGWVNIDINKDVRPDIVADITDLNMFEDGSVDEIDCCHLFEHLTFPDAVRALKEWNRVLKEGGKLFLELPNLDRCVEILDNKEGEDAERLAMIGIYGFIPDIEREGVFQVHKYGWTPRTLSSEMEKAGFKDIKQVPITQTRRPASKYNRDMRLKGRK